MSIVSDEFARAVVRLRGPQAHGWLRRLPGILDEYSRRWSLTLDSPFAALSYNFAAPALRADGTPVVLKVGFRDDKEFRSEAEALRLFDGRGAVKLLDADLANAVMLLERLEPGAPLTSVVHDEQATAIAVRVMRQFWRPAPAQHPFPTVADWARGLARLRRRFDGGTGPIPTSLFEEAEALYRDLGATMAAPVVLHGDLHHDNILSAAREPWLAIDPKGLVGEPAYEVGALLRNPLPRLLAGPDPARVLARRVDQFAAELGVDRARVRGWGLAQAVLSACWSIEDAGEDAGADWVSWTVTCAQLLAAIQA